MFDGFYFNRFAEMKILDEAFPSVKSDSTKENKSSTQNNYNGFTASIPGSSKKTLDIKSSLSREKFEKFSIELSKKQPSSEIQRDDILKPKGLKQLKKQKSKKQLDLV
jgi:hypothetical protein